MIPGGGLNINEIRKRTQKGVRVYDQRWTPALKFQAPIFHCRERYNNEKRAIVLLDFDKIAHKRNNLDSFP